jgi:hypothetical protein
MPPNIVTENEPQLDAVSRLLSRANAERLRYGWARTTSNDSACGAAMTVTLPIDNEEMDSDTLKELASIARLITYARQSAKGLKADFPVWCLDLALGAVLQEIYDQGDQKQAFAEIDDESAMMAQRH